MAACAAFGLGLQSCGVITSAEDCSAKAVCVDDAARAEDTNVAPGAVETGSDTPEVTFLTAAGDDVAAVEEIRTDLANGEVTDGASDASPDELHGSDVGGEDGATADAIGVIDDSRAEAMASSDACTPSGPEVCTNGIDDDCNGLTDCADPACSTYVCAAQAPSGWQGPIAFWQATNPAAAPACQTSYGNPIDANSGLAAPAATCGACTCAASGQTCAAISAYVDSDTGCGTACPGVSASSGTCADLPNCGGASFSMKLPAPAATGGTCTPNPGSVTVTPASWTSSARICSYAGPLDSPGGCPGALDQCLLAPTKGYATTPCVYSTASPPPTSCPSPYNGGSPIVFYSGVSDTRGCAGCACASGGPSGGSCSGTLTIFAVAGCTGATTSYTLGSGCDMSLGLSPRAASVRGSFMVSNAGACSVQTQAAPSGTATATGPLTVCCM